MKKLANVNNRISRTSNVAYSLIFIIIAIMCVVPLIFVIIISFTSDESIQVFGYQFIPDSWSLSAYQYIWDLKDLVGTSFLVSVGVTIFGTLIGVYMNSAMGYALSRRSFSMRKVYTWIIFIPMLFSGGLVASFLVNTRILNLGNTYWALILPLTVSSFYVIILRTFFQQTVPDSVVESAKMDGASQLLIYYRIVLPMSLPALATIGLLLSFTYWNDWFSALLYLQSNHSHMFPLQYLLVQIDRSIQFLAQNSEFMGTEVSRLPAESARMAIVVVVVLPIAMSYPFFQKYFVSGLTIGAVKG